MSLNGLPGGFTVSQTGRILNLESSKCRHAEEEEVEEEAAAAVTTRAGNSNPFWLKGASLPQLAAFGF